MTDVHPLTKFRLEQIPPLSRHDLARLLNVARETVWKWESWQQMPEPKLLPNIIKKTGIPARELRPDLAEIMQS